jgi:hypothetical protein
MTRHISHSSRKKKAEIPGVLCSGEYFFLRSRENCWSVMFHTLTFISKVVLSSAVLFCFVAVFARSKCSVLLDYD